jgi:large subunit ribosomal protein L4
MFVKVYNQNGEETGKTLLPKGIFDIEINTDLLWQVVRSYTANQRQGSAHTKTKGEVSGGGKKPWRQKGTGRSRHSSIRSPIWRGGGTVFGPRNDKIWKQKINKKMARKSLLMALSSKAKEENIVVLEDLKLSEVKTREVAKIIANLRTKIVNFKKAKTLVVLSGFDKNLIRAAKNIVDLKTIEARNLNALEILSFKYLLMTKDTISALKKVFLKKEETP